MTTAAQQPALTPAQAHSIAMQLERIAERLARGGHGMAAAVLAVSYRLEDDTVNNGSTRS